MINLSPKAKQQVPRKYDCLFFVTISTLTAIFIYILFSFEYIFVLFQSTSLTDVMVNNDSLLINNQTSLMRSEFIWASFYLLLPIWISILWIFKFGTSLKYAAYKSRLYWLLSILRYVVALFASYNILFYHKQYHDDLISNYMLRMSGSYLQWSLVFLVFALLVADYNKVLLYFKDFTEKRPCLAQIIWILLIAIVCFMIIEFFCASKTMTKQNMKIFNIAYWIISQFIIWLVIRNIKPGAILCIGVAWIIGFANYCVMQFRGNYITAGDLTVIRTALEVSDNYTLHFDFYFYLSTILALSSIILTCLVPLKKAYKKQQSFMRFCSTIIGEVLFILSIFLLFRSGFLYNNIVGISWDYTRNIQRVGYLPFFISNLNTTANINVEGYTPDAAANQLDKTLSDSTEVPLTKSTPNIIVIMNEAFSDLGVIADFKTDRDYMPFIHSLKEDSIKGYLNMSITGGPTGNTEFEFLTGSSLAFLPYGSIPYTQYIKGDTSSIVSALKSQHNVYQTVAYHSYYPSGYNRKSVYKDFDFDKIMFINDADNTEKVRNLISDKAHYQTLINLYEKRTKDAPFFMFNVTIQNHGGYTANNYTFDNPITITSFDATRSLNTYLSLIRESDEAFKDLINYFKQKNEPTIILMFGDHQPKMDEEALAQLEEHTYKDSSKFDDASYQAELSKYYVPFIMWANYDIPEIDWMGSTPTEGRYNKMSINYLSSYLLKIAGVPLTPYQRFLMKMHEEIPAFSALGYWDKDGEYYSHNDSNKYSDIIHTYEMLQYNMLFDKEHLLTSIFELPG